MFERRPHPDSTKVRLETLAAQAKQNPPPTQTFVFTTAEGAPDQRPRFRWAARKAGRLVERWLPNAAPPRKRHAFYASIAAVAGLVVLAGVWWQRPTPERPPDLPVAVAAITSNPPDLLVVNVVGEVPRPGLVTVTSGARVADAIQAAGGTNPGVQPQGVNLARKLTDGEQVAVNTTAAPGEAQPPEKLDLNTATKDQLDGLPGVGPVTAQRILDRRTKRGPYTSLDQLRDVEGIGDTRLERLRELVRI